ncbi:MAG TPA: hypothetical protein V6C84_02320 [Coleofasciculaceae cyanobacterium]|jgi:hypothetical protein
MKFASLLWETVYHFSPAIKEGLTSGRYEQVISEAGRLLPIARDIATGKFVGIAKAGTQLAAGPVIAIAEAVQTGVLSFQMDRGFQKTYRNIAAVQEGIKSLQSGMTTLQTSVSILQASTALIGVGTVAGVALSAVNLHQMFKLREDVKKLQLEVKDGFIDLKTVLQDQGTAVLQRLDEVANDLKFHDQKLLMIKAYGQFREAVRLVKTALVCTEMSTRNDTLTAALNLLTHALSAYNSAELCIDTSAAGLLRRMECVWAIEQMIALIYQLRGEPGAVSDRLSHLQQQIQNQSLQVVDQCESEAELDLLFPEVTRLQRCDLPILQTWQDQIEWSQTLVPQEQKHLAELEVGTAGELKADELEDWVELPEQSLYNSLKKTSHFLSLRDQLRLIVKPDLRQHYETYIRERSPAAGYKALAHAQWQDVSDLTVTNLYWHLKRTEQAA